MTEPCDLSAVAARRLIGTGKLSPTELLESCVKRIEKTNGKVNAIVAMDVDAARKAARAAEETMRKGHRARAARRPTGRRQGSAGNRGLAHDVGLAAAQGQRAGRGRAERRQRAQGRRRHPRQDQHARVRRRRQHHQSRVRADRQSVRSDEDAGGLLRRLGRRPGARHGAAGHRLRLRRQPAHAGFVLRRGRLPAVAGHRAERRSRRLPRAVRRHRADGPHGGGRAPAAARAARPGQARPVLLRRQRASSRHG